MHSEILLLMNKSAQLSILICILFVFAIIILFPSCKTSRQIDVQSYKDLEYRNTIRVMFYNTENIFDTINDPLTQDDEFLPQGSYHWNSFRYYKKLQDIAKVIIAVGGWDVPEIIGLCEIENRQVLEDLIRLTPLKDSGLEIIHKESPDDRGVDVALLYKSKRFQPLFYAFYEVIFPFAPGSKTREILYAKGVLDTQDTLHVFVNHWPSRRGGKEESENRRITAAELLRSKVDSLYALNPFSNIVIIGDFNDEPYDKSIKEVLKAVDDTTGLSYNMLFNLLAYYPEKGEGSYKFQYEWSQIDQIIVSSPLLLRKNSLWCNINSAFVFKEDWMLEEDSKYTGKKPFRTYLGPGYQGGISDHFPVYTDLYHTRNEIK